MGNYCYLCLVHQTTVSIWKVTGATPSLHFKQVRKINASPIQQGEEKSRVQTLKLNSCTHYKMFMSNDNNLADTLYE